MNLTTRLAIVFAALLLSITAYAPPVAATPDPCKQYLQLAARVGWKPEQAKTLRRVLFRESRCLPWVHNKLDVNGGSYGLLQVNGYFCRSSRYWPDGYLQTHRILNTCERLFDPIVNLKAGLLIWNLNKSWQPWGIKP